MESNTQEDISMEDVLGAGTLKPAKPTIQAKTIQELYGSIGFPEDDDLMLLGRKLEDLGKDLLRFWAVTLFGVENSRRLQFDGFDGKNGQVSFFDSQDIAYHAEVHTYAIIRLLYDIAIELEHRGMRANLASELDIAGPHPTGSRFYQPPRSGSDAGSSGPPIMILKTQ
jgi:hypothetical protein